MDINVSSLRSFCRLFHDQGPKGKKYSFPKICQDSAHIKKQLAYSSCQHLNHAKNMKAT